MAGLSRLELVKGHYKLVFKHVQFRFESHALSPKSVYVCVCVRSFFFFCVIVLHALTCEGNGGESRTRGQKV